MKTYSIDGLKIDSNGVVIAKAVLKKLKKKPRKSDIQRWYALHNTPSGQQRLFYESKARYLFSYAARRSGKSEVAKRRLVKEAFFTKYPGRFGVLANSHAQVVRIYWEDLKRMTYAYSMKKKPSETHKVIFLDNGSTIELLSLDAAAKLDGALFRGLLVDELADADASVFPNHILPALQTKDPTCGDYRSFLMCIGTPSGKNHYYDLVQNALERIRQGDTDYEVYHWKSSEVLGEDEVNRLRSMMSEVEFRTEFLGEFLDQSSTIYADFSEDNASKAELGENDEMRICFDWNYSPQSMAVAVRRRQRTQVPPQNDPLYDDNENLLNYNWHIVDEIVLHSASVAQVAEEFIQKFSSRKNKSVIIYGDPAGNAGSKHGIQSNFQVIETILQTAGWTTERRIKSAPPIIVRQNSVRALIKSADGVRRLFVNKTTAPTAWKGFERTKYIDGSSYQESQKPSEYWQHITTAIGYMIEYETGTLNKQNILPVSKQIIAQTVPLSQFNFNNQVIRK